MKKYVLFIFLAVSVGELLSIIFYLPKVHIICKPMIMISLGAYYWMNASEKRSSTVLLAVVFSCAGDIALMLESQQAIFFMVGLSAFLLSHIMYILSYRQHQHQETADGLQGVQKARLSFPIILAGSGLVVIIYPNLGVLKFPVMLYAFVLVVMVLNALFRYGRTSTESFWLVFFGALLFMISDSLLAVNKFLQPVWQSGLLIMSTYIMAQFLLIEGLLRHSNTFAININER